MSQFFLIGHWESKAIHKKCLSQLLTKLRHLAIFKIHIMDPHSDLPGLSDYDSDDEDDFDIVESQRIYIGIIRNCGGNDWICSVE